MRQYESAFLGLILAGVVMMIIGLGLMMSSVRTSDRHAALVERQGVADTKDAQPINR
jgi:hypothetical protein